MTETQSCIWLQCVFGPGSPLPGRIAAEYESIVKFYEAGVMEWQLSGLFTGAQIDKMETTSPREAERIFQMCSSNRYQVIGITDARYPACLKDLNAPPAVLYVDGKLPDFSRKIAIAMVGTREATPYGVQVAAQLATELVQRGAIVVSGGALGVDTASHRGALMGGGCTVAVLGCGFHARYLRTNESLRRQIARTGALISEYSPDTPVHQGSFPMRNRIIAALSKGTVVVEAGEKSGALITARDALELGRDVFAVPGNILSKCSAGVHRMLKEGAKPVTHAGDILEEYEPVYGAYLQQAPQVQPEFPVPVQEPVPAVPVRKTARKKTESAVPEKKPSKAPGKAPEITDRCAGAGRPDGPVDKADNIPAAAEVSPAELELLSPEAKKLYDALTVHPQPVDELSIKTGPAPRQTLASVTELEMLGLIDALPGKQYALKTKGTKQNGRSDHR
jgi:DNA processing protein